MWWSKAWRLYDPPGSSTEFAAAALGLPALELVVLMRVVVFTVVVVVEGEEELMWGDWLSLMGGRRAVAPRPRIG